MMVGVVIYNVLFLAPLFTILWKDLSNATILSLNVTILSALM